MHKLHISRGGQSQDKDKGKGKGKASEGKGKASMGKGKEADASKGKGQSKDKDMDKDMEASSDDSAPKPVIPCAWVHGGWMPHPAAAAVAAAVEARRESDEDVFMRLLGDPILVDMAMDKMRQRRT